MSVTLTGDGPNITMTGSGSSFTITVTTGSGGGGGGVTDHGLLTGLADDDHTQYAKKASNLSDLASASTARTNLGLGTAATAATGDFAAASHVHSGADITSGTIGTARLASGSASSSTFLRGDQTWATPAGGSVATDTVWDAAGDIVYGTGADTATRLALGTRGQALVAGASAPEYQRRRPLGGGYQPTDSSFADVAIASTLPVWGNISNGSTLTSQRVALVPILLDEGETITSITFVSGTTAAVTPANQWFALCDAAGVALRYTVDDTTTAWGSSTRKTLALSSTYATTYRGRYFLAICVNAATVPSLRATPTPTGLTTPTINGNTGVTTPPAEGTDLNGSASAALSTIPYAEVA